MRKVETAAGMETRREAEMQRTELAQRYRRIRSFTEALTEPLETEDFVIQIAEHASPVKWHLAHTSWFFETFLLKKAVRDYRAIDPDYAHLFNSYYLQTGVPHCRARRGNLSRPTVREVFRYRSRIDEQVLDLLENAPASSFQQWAPVVDIGLHHEQQHQELVLTDLKLLFSRNPLLPAYRSLSRPRVRSVPEQSWSRYGEGIREIGHEGGDFGYDNEFPRHKVWLHEFELSTRLVTNGEYLEFMQDGGYGEVRWWLDEGYAAVRDQGWNAPLYWIRRDGRWHQFTLNGLEKIDRCEPVCHISYYEADAYARWAGCRLPTEQEWETAAGEVPEGANFVERDHLQPAAAGSAEEGPLQMFGDLWEWTASAYAPYPGYSRLPGALGEYNGKFMCGQYVLRGGSCATPEQHIRASYRNFFHPPARWQFSGIRLARDTAGTPG